MAVSGERDTSRSWIINEHSFNAIAILAQIIQICQCAHCQVVRDMARTRYYATLGLADLNELKELMLRMSATAPSQTADTAQKRPTH